MKRTLLSLIFIFLVYGAFAQLTAGIKAGINLAQVHAEVDGESETSDMMVGFQFGGYLTYPLSQNISIQPELVFNRVGGKESGYDEDLQAEVDATLKTDYLSIPVMLRFKVGENFHMLAGPQAGILISAKAKLEAFGESIEVDIEDSYKTLDFGLTAGLGYSKNKFGIDVRYNFGLANVADDAENDGKIQNRVFMLSVSYKLHEK